MAETGRSRWDTQGLGTGLAVGLVGVALLVGRDGSDLRPVHLLGIVVLAVGAAVVVAALDRPARQRTGAGPDRLAP